jgi:hypothetical protein
MPLLRELRENDPEDFKNYLQMDNSTFEYILNIISPYISKKDTVMRKCITAEERLAATIRFFGVLHYSRCPSLVNNNNSKYHRFGLCISSSEEPLLFVSLVFFNSLRKDPRMP